MALPDWHGGAADWSAVKWDDGTYLLAVEFEGTAEEIRTVLRDDGTVEILYADARFESESYSSLAEFAASSFSEGRNFAFISPMTEGPLLRLWEITDPEARLYAEWDEWPVGEYLDHGMPRCLWSLTGMRPRQARPWDRPAARALRRQHSDGRT